MKGIRKVVNQICKFLAYIGCAAVFIVMFIMVIDIIMSLVSNSRILGNYELTELGMILLIFFGIAYTQTQKGHVRVDMFIGFLPKKARSIVDGIVTLITAAVVGLMTYAAFIQAGVYASSGTTSSVLHITYAPFGYVMAVGFFLYAIVLIVDAIDLFIKGVTYKKEVVSE